MNSNSTPVSANSDELESFRRSLSQLQTPSAIERVVDWMGINETDPLVYEGLETKYDDSGMFYRCDYKVNDAHSKTKNGNTILTSIFNKGVPLCESTKSIECKSVCMPKEVDYQETQKLCNEYVNSQSLKRHSSHSIAPPSVESKKKELCSYLKLMTRGDKKEVFSSQYRRSTRVQNLEKKRKTPTKNPFNDEEVYSVKSLKTSNEIELIDKGESIALQSFEDLNMVVDTSKYPFLLENVSRKVFNFIMPPDYVLKEFNDFQHWIEPFLDTHNHQDETLNLDYNNCNNDNEIENHCDNQEIKMKISETNRIDRKNRELNRFRKRIKKKITLNGGSCQDKKENYSSIVINDEKEQEPDNTIHDRSTNHKSSNKCIILLHDETIENGLSVKDFSKNLPKIEEDVNEQVDSTENITIRVDYDLEKPSKESSDIHVSNTNNRFKSFELPMPCCPGFSREEREKSEELLSKFNQSTSCIHCVPENKAYKNYTKNSRSLIRSKKKEFLPSKKNCDILNNAKSSSKGFVVEAEEMSNSSITSGSPSSILSDDSSSSNSTSLIEIKSLKNESMQKFDRISTSQITPRSVEVMPYHETPDVQSLHNLLKKQVKKVASSVVLNSVQDWDSDNSISGKQKFGTSKNNSHFISFSKDNGSIQNALYVDFHLILIQEYAVSMWNQTALGNVLGAQNLWIFNGDTKKLILNKECTRKHSLEMTVSMENCVAYVELWTKEHKSDIRQGPVADIFAIVYFWFQKLNKMDKKVHQLENINGFSDDVQYVVLKSSLNIVVSWHSVIDDTKVTQVRVYTMAADFQTIVNVRALSKVEHYVSSLHNIEDCEDLLMGCGEHTITLWNIEHGYIVASIQLNDIKLSLLTLWAKCDRGILFTVQQCVDKELRLIAINGRSHSWKKLKSYKPPEGFERIQNVYIENGVLISFYEEGILCWKAQTAEQILEENHETDMKYFPSGKYVIMATEKSIFIRHALTHLLTAD